VEFAAIKSSLGHAEAGAGMMGILCTVQRLGQAASLALTHLRTVNAHVASIIAAQAGICNVSMPKQAAPGQSRTNMHMGVSSFAFQVSRRAMLMEGCQITAQCSHEVRVGIRCLMSRSQYASTVCRAPMHM
jgi:hypothetical protein